VLVERQLQVDDVSVQLREWGSTGLPVIFWHALGDHSGMQMAEAGPILAKEYGLQVIAIDAPGFGGSTPRLPDEQYAVPELTSFIAKVLDALQLDRPAWLGSSWGAYLGVAFAGSHPAKVRAVALLDGGYFEDPDEPLLAFSLEALREEERGSPEFRWPSWKAAYAEYQGWAGRWSLELESYVRSVMREDGNEVVSIMGPDVFAAALYGLLHADMAVAQERLGQTDLPVLLVVAGDEPEGDEKKREKSVHQFQARIPQADVIRINAPHLMLEAQPAEVARIIGPWLRSHLTKGIEDGSAWRTLTSLGKY
jgi:pimeloyl-ACP methyl ester carboxylesterase